MILGALVDAGLSHRQLIHGLSTLPLEGYAVRASRVQRAGLHARKVDVLIKKGFGRPLTLRQIQRFIAQSRLPPPVKATSATVFAALAEAEGLAHRVGVEEVRFHEVGVVDSVVDVIGSVLGCHLLGVNRITSSPINLGSGWIESAHGMLPVPGPAVSVLARGVPVYSRGPSRELTTPTGIALLRTLASDFLPLPPMRVSAVGYGAGTGDPPDWPNVLRVFMGEGLRPAEETDMIAQLETHLDDLNPQLYELVMERLFTAGAVDVTLTPLIMKRGRPGIRLSALVAPERAEQVCQVMFRETTTLGIRLQLLSRRVLPGQVKAVQTQAGVVRMKVARLAPGEIKAAPEYRDCRKLAEESGKPIREIIDDAMAAWRRASRIGRPNRTRRTP